MTDDSAHVPSTETKATKAWVGLLISALGAAGTAALAFAVPGSAIFIGLSIGLAALTPIATYVGVYLTTNKAKNTEGKG